MSETSNVLPTCAPHGEAIVDFPLVGWSHISDGASCESAETSPTPAVEPDPWACPRCGNTAFGPGHLIRCPACPPADEPLKFDVTKLTPGQLFGVDCVTCGSSEQPMRPVGIHNGVQLFACTSHDEQPAAEDWTPAESAGTEYHWMLCYIVPQIPYAFDARQQSGVITLTDETRAQAFEKLVMRVVKEDGLSVGDFSVTSFSLEPNRLQPPAWGVLEWYTEPAVRLPQRGDAVEAWLTARRDAAIDAFGNTSAWHIADSLLDEYHAHADAGIPLGQPLPDAGREDGQ